MFDSMACIIEQLVFIVKTFYSAGSAVMLNAIFLQNPAAGNVKESVFGNVHHTVDELKGEI
jgi:hypothetical protein